MKIVILTMVAGSYRAEKPTALDDANLKAGIEKKPVVGFSALLVLIFVLLPLNYAFAEEPVYFTDKRLKKVVESRLNVSNPTPKDMLALTRLNANRKNIQNLEGLQYAKNLSYLILSQNPEIEDIIVLSSLKQLKTIRLVRSRITDLNFLLPLSQLEELDLSYNDIADLSVLASLTTLKKLNLEHNHLTNISPLASLTSLTHLSLIENDIQDISPLKSLSNLKYLHLRYNKVKDASALSSLPGSALVDLRNNPIHSKRVAVRRSIFFFIVSIIIIIIIVAGMRLLHLHDKKNRKKVSNIPNLSFAFSITLPIFFLTLQFFLITDTPHGFSSFSFETDFILVTAIIMIIVCLILVILGLISLLNIRRNDALAGKKRTYLAIAICALHLIGFVSIFLNEFAGAVMAV